VGVRTAVALAVTLDASVDVVERLTSAQLRLATPCPAWSVRDVIEHAVGITEKFTAFAAGVTDQPKTPRTRAGSRLGEGTAAAGLRTALRTASSAAKAAWATADPTRTCRLPFGSFSAELAAGINLFDLLAHGWDVEVATAEAFACPDDVWTTGLWAARRVIGDDRDPRHFAPALSPGRNPTIRAEFLSFLGRDPATETAPVPGVSPASRRDR
jgi:uncharacterized protein (TIGR03086 family)